MFPEPVQWAAGLLPLTHGLDAVREPFGNARADVGVGVIISNVGLEALVGAGWLLASLLTSPDWPTRLLHHLTPAVPGRRAVRWKQAASIAARSSRCC